jgi:malate synthase
MEKEIEIAFTKVHEGIEKLATSVATSFHALNEKMDTGFKAVDERFEEMDQRFDQVDHRLGLLESEVRELRNETRSIRAALE